MGRPTLVDSLPMLGQPRAMTGYILIWHQHIGLAKPGLAGDHGFTEK